METTREERERWLKAHNYQVPHPQDDRVVRLCRDVDTLVAALGDRARAAHDFGAALGPDSSGHLGEFERCQNGKCIEARAVLGE
jgi:hypothetical protein